MVWPTQNLASKGGVQRWTFVTAQQQKTNNPCQSAKTLFCAKVRRSFVTRLFPCTKSCHTPSSSTRKQQDGNFFGQQWVYWKGGYQYWPLLYRKHLAFFFSQTPYSFIIFVALWWIHQTSWPFLLSLIHIWRCRRIERCRSRWSPYH